MVILLSASGAGFIPAALFYLDLFISSPSFHTWLVNWFIFFIHWFYACPFQWPIGPLSPYLPFVFWVAAFLSSFTGRYPSPSQNRLVIFRRSSRVGNLSSPFTRYMYFIAKPPFLSWYAIRVVFLYFWISFACCICYIAHINLKISCSFYNVLTGRCRGRVHKKEWYGR